MATTTNYGWDTPDDTDLVKDGADAMRELGQDIDTSLYDITGGKDVGLQLIQTVNLSGTSLTISNCFTSAYTNYLVVSDHLNNSGLVTDMTFQFRASGTTTVTGYTTSIIFTQAGAAPAVFQSGSSHLIAGAMSNKACGIEITIYGPQLAGTTTVTGLSTAFGSTPSSQQSIIFGMLDNSTQYDSLVINNANTMSGTLSIYGYAK
jgi:hypothetical protein